MTPTQMYAAWEAVSREQRKELKLNLEIFAKDDVAVVWCKGRITFCNEAQAFAGKVGELLPHTGQLVLEFSGVEKIDCAGLGKLVDLLVRSRASGCAIKLAGLPNRVHRMLEITNLVSVFEIHPTLKDAMIAFRGEMACSN